MITRYLFPYSLREKISARLGPRWGRRLPSKNIPLVFAPAIRMDLNAEDVAHQAIILNGFYELPVTRRILQLARKGGFLVDAGANFGYYSLLWTAQRHENHCVAFEAAPANLEPLRANVFRNKLADQVRIEALALSDRNGPVAFALENAGGQTGWGGIAPGQTPGTITVSAVSLDAYWTENYPERAIDVLKIDVEGADTLVLEGARGLLAEGRIRHIFYEVNRPRMQALGIAEQRARDLLFRHGYRLETIAPNEMHAWI